MQDIKGRLTEYRNYKPRIYVAVKTKDGESNEQKAVLPQRANARGSVTMESAGLPGYTSKR